MHIIAIEYLTLVFIGLAIQAAILSKQIPLHKLKSAMMLDVVPHAIGVRVCRDAAAAAGVNESSFVEIIPRNTLLPARGSATFVLANKYQAGVTIPAVEEVDVGIYEPMSKEDFSFLLRRLPARQFESMSERTIQVGMKVDTDGKFIVSIFDENDPEQVRKRDRFNQDVAGELDFIKDMMIAESGVTKEQVNLFLVLVSLFVLYIAVKINFSDPLGDLGSSLR